MFPEKDAASLALQYGVVNDKSGHEGRYLLVAEA